VADTHLFIVWVIKHQSTNNFLGRPILHQSTFNVANQLGVGLSDTMMSDAFSLIRVFLCSIIVVDRIIRISRPVSFDFATDGCVMSIELPGNLSQA
jgi:hypothetical protein